MQKWQSQGLKHLQNGYKIVAGVLKKGEVPG
jgi:hypothetical protein